MAQIFPEWTNKLPFVSALGVGLIAVLAVGFFWYYGSPQYTDVGYRPEQPVKYSHKLHAGDLGIDCRYCHNFVETSAVANVPPTQTCMNCHTMIGTDNEKVLPVRESWSTGRPTPPSPSASPCGEAGWSSNSPGGPKTDCPTASA